MRPEEARRAARIELGGVEPLKEAVRDVRAGRALTGLFVDLRQAFRGMRRTPGWTVVIVLTLAVGLGATTAIFGVVNAVLLRPLPYPDSDRLAIVWSTVGPESRAPASGPQFLSLGERSRLFDAFGGIWVNNAALTGGGEPEQIKVGNVSPGFLPLLVERPALGRHFKAGEDGDGKPLVVLLTDGLWRRRYGADPSIVGRTVQMDGRPAEVVGVLPPGFKVSFPAPARVSSELDAFIPFPFDLAGGPRNLAYVRILGRMRPGVTPHQAQAEMDQIAAALRSEFAEYAEEGLQMRVAPLQEEIVSPSRPALLALFGGVGLVLLIACINVASLLLARGAERQREMTVRSALGAAPFRIVRQLLTESLALALLGGAVALLLGGWVLRGFAALEPEGLPRTAPVRFDLVVFGFTLAVTVVAGILSGLAPAIEATRGTLAEALKKSGRGHSGGAQRARSVLIACEVALGCALLISAGLMARTLRSLLNVDPGFDPRGSLTLQISLPGGRYRSDHDRVEFARRLVEKLREMPGVRSAGLSSNLPLDDGLPNWYSPCWREGASEAERNGLMADHRSVLPGAFDAIGARLLEGRDFDAQEVESGRLVAIIDDSLARRTWPEGGAVGRRINLETMKEGAFESHLAEIIGVVKHVQYHSLTDEVRGQVYMPYSLAPRQQISFIVRTDADPAALAGPARAAVMALDPELPVSKVLPLEQYVTRARNAARFGSQLAATLAGIALLLAVVGVYGVTSGAVARRTGEIGVRVALGARRGDVMRLVLAQGMKPVLIGCAVGLGLSAALSRFYAHLLYGVSGRDLATHAAVLGVLGLAGLLACYLPARRAVRLDPLEALRAD